MLKVTNLTKNYGQTKALDKVTFSVEKGKITAFLGPNGAGKTTTMRILTGFLLPESGKITFDERSLKLKLSEIINEIGYLPENNPMYSNLRVDEFLKWIAQMKGAHHSENLLEIAEKCGIDKVLDKEIDTLSKGYKQRVGLAKALIGEPNYLILDEPTEGLDPNQKQEILKLIKEVSKEKTILFSSHVLSEVTQVAHNVIIINKGKVVAEGNKEALLKEHLKNATIKIATDAPTTKLRQTLQKIKTIEAIAKTTNRRTGFNEYTIGCKDPEETALKIFENIVRNKWKLTELHTESLGLEELFTELTK
ncbi:ATP-binding cassette domain-containing protein [Candidatus Dojkabacteria bacterium]|nr:ATP-binding cassette domain-containing protein [Candidatus Dojkabacteria bacterium]